MFFFKETYLQGMGNYNTSGGAIVTTGALSY